MNQLFADHPQFQIHAAIQADDPALSAVVSPLHSGGGASQKIFGLFIMPANGNNGHSGILSLRPENKQNNNFERLPLTR